MLTRTEGSIVPILLAIIFCSFQLASAQSEQAQANREVSRGPDLRALKGRANQLVESKRYKEAAAEFVGLATAFAALHQVDEANDATLNAARCCLQFDNFQQARILVTPLFDALRPESGAAHKRRVLVIVGCVELGDKHFVRAEQLFRESLAIIPEDADDLYDRALILRGLGICLIKTDRLVEAELLLLKACGWYAATGANTLAADTFWDLYNAEMPDKRLELMTNVNFFQVEPTSELAIALGTKYLTIRAALTLQSGDLATSTLWSRAIMKCIEQHGDSVSADEFVSAVSCAASVFTVTTTPKEAIEALQRAVPFVAAKKIGPEVAAEFYLTFALSQFKYNTEGARVSYESAVTSLGDRGSPFLRLRMMLTKACIEGASGNVTECSRLLKHIQDQCDKAGVRTMGVSLLMANSLALREGQHFGAAVEFARRALALCETSSSLAGKVRAELAMGLAAKHEWKEAAKEMLSALRAERLEAVVRILLIPESERYFVTDGFLSADSDLVISLAIAADSTLTPMALEAAWLSDHLGTDAAQVAARALNGQLPVDGEAARQRWERARDQLAMDSKVLLTAGSNPDAELITRVKSAEEQLSAAWTLASEWAMRTARVDTKFISFEDLLRTLDQGQVLIQYVKYSPVEQLSEQWKVQGIDTEFKRYAAIAVSRNGAVIADIGNAPELEKMISEYMKALAEDVPRDRDGELLLAQRGTALRKKIIDPVEPALQGVSQLFIAPAGQLNLLPFQALPVDDDSSNPKYLLERMEIVYAQSVPEMFSPRARSTTSMRFVMAPDDNASEDQIADSVCVQSKDHVYGALPSSSDPFAELAASMEVVHREAIAKGIESELYLGSAACRPAILQPRTNRLGLLVLAAHGNMLSESTNRYVSPYLRSQVLLAGWKAPLSTLRLKRVDGHFARADQEVEVRTIALGDGRLTAFDLGGSRAGVPQTGLLLSCEIGAGAREGLDWIGGLRTALLCHGAEAVVCATINIPISTSVPITTQVVRAAASRGESITAADLRSAQLAQLERLRKGEGPVDACGHPYWWASLSYWGRAK